MSNTTRQNRLLKTTIVYWGNPTADGYGGYTFDDPIEIKCRWEDRTELFVDPNGKEQRSTAVVYVDRAVAVEGYLFKGTLEDLTSAEEGDPQTVSAAKEIKQCRSVPNRDETFFVRNVWL